MPPSITPHFDAFTNRRVTPNQKFLKKLPKSIGYDELNVFFGMGTQTVGAAGPISLTQAVNRPVILRDLVIALGAVRGRITALTASGDTLLQGSSAPVELFSPLNPNRPEFDMPVYTGNVVIAGTADAAFTCDAAFIID